LVLKGISQMQITELQQKLRFEEESNRKLVTKNLQLNKELNVFREQVLDLTQKLLILTNLAHVTPLIGPLLRAEVPEEIREKLLTLLNSGLDILLNEGRLHSVK